MSFPILNWEEYPGSPSSIPSELVRDCEAQAQRNHGQSLERLAQRGGLSPCELYAVMRGQSLMAARNVPKSIAVEFINEQIKLFKAARAKEGT